MHPPTPPLQTILLTLLLTLTLTTAQGPNCTTPCLGIGDLRGLTNPCGRITDDSTSSTWKFLWRGRRTGTLFLHKKNTKVEIGKDNVLHMWCHNSGCWRFDYCRLWIDFKDSTKNDNNVKSYMLPGYNDCCSLPEGYIEEAYMAPVNA